METSQTFDPCVMPDVAPVDPINTYDECDKALLKIAQCDTILQSEEAEMNDMIQKVRDTFETKTFFIRTQRSLFAAEVTGFLCDHKSDYEKVRSRELTHGTVGFRTSTPKLSPLNRKYKWDTILELLKKVRWGKDFIRTKDEVNKEAILAQITAKKLNDAKLATVGIKMDQDDNSFFEIKWDSIPELN